MIFKIRKKSKLDYIKPILVIFLGFLIAIGSFYYLTPKGLVASDSSILDNISLSVFIIVAAIGVIFLLAQYGYMRTSRFKDLQIKYTPLNIASIIFSFFLVLFSLLLFLPILSSTSNIDKWNSKQDEFQKYNAEKLHEELDQHTDAVDRINDIVNVGQAISFLIDDNNFNKDKFKKKYTYDMNFLFEKSNGEYYFYAPKTTFQFYMKRDNIEEIDNEEGSDIGIPGSINSNSSSEGESDPHISYVSFTLNLYPVAKKNITSSENLELQIRAMGKSNYNTYVVGNILLYLLANIGIFVVMLRGKK